MQPQGRITRLAPSPTGALHLGHAFTFLLNWALARREGWQVRLRLDDLDVSRVASSAHDPLESLRWLGVDWDGEAIRQRDRMDRYRAAMERLAALGLAFRSPHSRSEVREAALAAGAPQEGESAIVFPRSLRPGSSEAWGFRGEAVNHRVAIDEPAAAVEDRVQGATIIDVSREHGDFIVWTKAGIPSYQLACAVDDGELGVTDVVRGADLLPSAGPQRMLLRTLGHREPEWWHLPLVRDSAGRRLAKRDGAEGLDSLRQRGMTAERIAGLVAWSTRLAPLAPLRPDRLPDLAEPERLVRGLRSLAAAGGLRATPETIAWLTGDDAAAAMLPRDARGSAP